MIRVSFLSLAVILASLVVASSAMVLWLWLARRRRDVALRDHGKPILVMPLASSPSVPRTPIVREAPSMRRSPVTALAVAEHLPAAEYQMLDESPERDLVTMTTGETVTSETYHPHGAVAEMIQGSALRFHRPADPTRAYLPGHLCVAEGPDVGLEVRFVRTAGEHPPVITFGRSEGPPFRHVQLLEPTVSRAHARLTFVDDSWYLSNLSRTNPVVLNRAALTSDEGVRLHDGDRIEMGALVFRFRSP